MNEITCADQLRDIAMSGDSYPVDFDQAWQWVGYSNKANALRTLQDNFEEGLEFSSKLMKTSKGSKDGRPSQGYYLTTDCFKAFCMMAKTEKGKEVRKYYLELEKHVTAFKLHIRHNAEVLSIPETSLEDISRVPVIPGSFAYGFYTLPLAAQLSRAEIIEQEAAQRVKDLRQQMSEGQQQKVEKLQKENEQLQRSLKQLYEIIWQETVAHNQTKKKLERYESIDRDEQP